MTNEEDGVVTTVVQDALDSVNSLTGDAVIAIGALEDVAVTAAHSGVDAVDAAADALLKEVEEIREKLFDAASKFARVATERLP